MSGRSLRRVSRQFWIHGDVDRRGQIYCRICNCFAEPTHLALHVAENQRYYRLAIAFLERLEGVARIVPTRRRNVLAEALASGEGA